MQRRPRRPVAVPCILTHALVGRITEGRRPGRQGGKTAGSAEDQTGTLPAAFFRLEPAVTLTVFAAGMSMDSPVCGLRPVRADR